MAQGLKLALRNELQDRAVSTLPKPYLISEGFDADGTSEVASNGAHSVLSVRVAIVDRGVYIRVVQGNLVDIRLCQQSHRGGKVLFLNPPSYDLHFFEEVFRVQPRGRFDSACDPFATRFCDQHIEDMPFFIAPTELKKRLFDNIRNIGLCKLKGLMVYFQLALTLHTGTSPFPTYRMGGAVPF
jgi:hypothetical protein